MSAIELSSQNEAIESVDSSIEVNKKLESAGLNEEQQQNFSDFVVAYSDRAESLYADILNVDALQLKMYIANNGFICDDIDGASYAV